MRIAKSFLPLLAIVGLGFAGSAATACHAEGHAQVAVNSDSASASVETPPPPDSTPPAASSAPTPPPPRKITLKGANMKGSSQVDLPGAIDFDTASAKIKNTKTTTDTLTAVTTLLQNNPDINLLSVEGNTDNEGEPKFDNVKLSQQRAQSVVDYLTKKGIDASRLQAQGFGSTHALVPNDSADHKAQNRRVEFHILKFAGQDVTHDPPPPPIGNAIAGALGGSVSSASSAAPASSGTTGTPKPKSH